MAYKSKDGKEFTNRPVMKQHEARMDANMKEEAPMPAGEPDGDEMQQEADPGAVVGQHGPAHELHIVHDEGGSTVESKHGDGHTHHSRHHSPAEAHAHAAALAGDHQEPDADDAAGPEEVLRPKGALPGLE